MSGRSCTGGVLMKRAGSKSGTLGFNSWSIVSASDGALSAPMYSILDTFSILSYVVGNAHITSYLPSLSPACQRFATSLSVYACTCPWNPIVGNPSKLRSYNHSDPRQDPAAPTLLPSRYIIVLTNFHLYQLPHAPHLASRPQSHPRNQIYCPLKRKTKS